MIYDNLARSEKVIESFGILEFWKEEFVVKKTKKVMKVKVKVERRILYI
jgi:hypothetical protein